MPKNEDLIKSITDVATEKGIDVPETENKSNNELVEILKTLNTPTPPAAPSDDDVAAKAASDAKAEAAKVKAEKKVKRPPFYIAEGKAITTKRGILGPDEEIRVKDLAGGKDAIEKFVKTGHILKG